MRGDVDPHFSGLGAREADGGAIGIEVRASALFECLGAWINDAHACEVVCCLVVRQYVKQAEEASAYSPGGRRDCREEEEIALVVLVVVELLLNGGIQSPVDVGGVRASRCVPGLRMSHGIRGDRSRRR